MTCLGPVSWHPARNSDPAAKASQIVGRNFIVVLRIVSNFLVLHVKNGHAMHLQIRCRLDLLSATERLQIAPGALYKVTEIVRATYEEVNGRDVPVVGEIRTSSTSNLLCPPRPTAPHRNRLIHPEMSYFQPKLLWIGERKRACGRRKYLFLSAGRAGRSSAATRYLDFCSAIHLLVRASSRSSGSVPPLSISSWKARRSNFGPNSFRARSRSSRNLSWPSL